MRRNSVFKKTVKRFSVSFLSCAMAVTLMPNVSFAKEIEDGEATEYVDILEDVDVTDDASTLENIEPTEDVDAIDDLEIEEIINGEYYTGIPDVTMRGYHIGGTPNNLKFSCVSGSHLSIDRWVVNEVLNSNGDIRRLDGNEQFTNAKQYQIELYFKADNGYEIDASKFTSEYAKLNGNKFPSPCMFVPEALGAGKALIKWYTPTALSVDEMDLVKIDSANAVLQSPIYAGNSFSRTVVNDASLPYKASVVVTGGNSIFDVTANQYLKSGAKYIEGHKYRVNMKFTANDGYKFTDNTKFSVQDVASSRFGNSNTITSVTVQAIIECKAKPQTPENIPAPKSANIYLDSVTRDKVTAHLTSDVTDKSKYEYSWYALKDGESNWVCVSDWKLGDEWLRWTPNSWGEYKIIGKIRAKGMNGTAIQTKEADASFHPYIKGKCQMPYTGKGGGYLIGVESYENPNQSYKYEMLILDCTLLAAGKDAWIYTTGQCGVSEGNALWTIWQPQYGYYWTLFRVFDGNGTMIDQACYGFVNAY